MRPRGWEPDLIRQGAHQEDLVADAVHGVADADGLDSCIEEVGLAEHLQQAPSSLPEEK